MVQAPEKTSIPGPVGRLEALVRRAPAPRAVAVVAHPHPRFGGTMHNPVVFHADRALHDAGLSTVRFNFRGVGGSDGAHDDGVGEVEDVAAVAGWAREAAAGRPLLLVGYSFGSLCSLRYAARGGALTALVAIGLPVRLYPIPEVARVTVPLWVVQGSEDQFGSPAAVRAAMVPKPPPAKLLVLPEADHLFHGRSRDVADLVRQAAEEALGAAGSGEG